MKSRNIVNISTRLQGKKEKIYLRKSVIIDGVMVDKRLSTGLEATESNLAIVELNADSMFDELLYGYKHSVPYFKEYYIEAMEFINLYVKDETKQRRDTNLRDAILPYLGDRAIDTITPFDIEEWQKSILLQRGGDYTTRLKSLLKRIFKRAVVKGLIKSNPCDNTEYIRKLRRKRREIYSKDEVELMLKEADGFLRAFILVYATLGLRTSEMIALKFSDIDFDIGTIHIQRGIRHGRIGTPKSGERLVDIPTLTHSTLWELKQLSSCDWVFPNKFGNHYHDGSSINAKKFQPFLKSIGVKYKSLYSLRHFKATFALRNGQDLAYLSKQIGHADIKTTLDFYIGYMENKENREKANEIFSF